MLQQELASVCLQRRHHDLEQLYTLGPAIRIPYYKNVGKDLALEGPRICPCLGQAPLHAIHAADSTPRPLPPLPPPPLPPPPPPVWPPEPSSSSRMRATLSRKDMPRRLRSAHALRSEDPNLDRHCARHAARTVLAHRFGQSLGSFGSSPPKIFSAWPNHGGPRLAPSLRSVGPLRCAQRRRTETAGRVRAPNPGERCHV